MGWACHAQPGVPRPFNGLQCFSLEKCIGVPCLASGVPRPCKCLRTLLDFSTGVPRPAPGMPC
ncbi:hypothetical protein AHAS_Ahas02G0170100 [Arachis hypogaea]